MFKKGKGKILAIFIVCLMGLTFLWGCNNSENREPQKAETNKTLFAYIGANLKEPINELVEAYQQETGVKVELTFNNSGALLNQVETTKKGDIYMPGGMPFVEQAKKKDFIDKVVGPIAYHTPVIITPEGNPGNITSVYDLANNGVELVIPDKEATAIGKTVYKVFEKIGKMEEIENNIIANLESPGKVMASIVMGQGNAGIVEYSNTQKEKDNIEVVEIDPQVNIVDEIPITSLVFSTDKELAEDFLNYILEKGPEVFEKYGFKITEP